MTDQIVRLGPEYFPRVTSGVPISGGSIYIGKPDLDPEIPANQIQVSALQENGTTVQIPQPISTSGGGVPLYNGSPVTLLVSESYSLKVLDSFDVQIYNVTYTNVPSDADAEDNVKSVEDILGLIEIPSPVNDQTYIVLSYFDGLNKGNGTFYWDSTANKSTANGGTIVDPDNIGGFDGTQSTVAAFLATQGSGVGFGCWVRTHEGTVLVTWFGAVGDSVGNDTAAFESALVFIDVVIPPGQYLIDGGLNIVRWGGKLRGAGKHATTITVTTSNLVGITIPSIGKVEISGFSLKRSVVPTSTGHGIDCADSNLGTSVIKDLEIRDHQDGLRLGGTDFSEVSRVTSRDNYNNGFYMQNPPGVEACQWTITDCLSQFNNGHGFYMQAVTGSAQVTMGTVKNFSTFANSGRGMIFLGLVGTPINDIRLKGGFLGDDGRSEIFLATYGGQHQIDGMFLETAGRDGTGIGRLEPASLQGSGIEITSNNENVQISDCHSNGHSHDGYYLNGDSATLGDCHATNNGQSVVAGRRNGLLSASGRVVINGGSYGNTAGVSQEYGANTHNGNVLAVIGADMTGNSVLPWIGATNDNFITSVGNLPNNLEVGLSPAGAVLVGGGATGDFNSAGTINVSGGLFKNDSAYANP